MDPETPQNEPEPQPAQDRADRLAGYDEAVGDEAVGDEAVKDETVRQGKPSEQSEGSEPDLDEPLLDEPLLDKDLQATLQRLERRWPRQQSELDSQAEAAFHEAIERRGSRIGRYIIERELGRGGFGIVFLAMEENSGQEVALKIPRAEVMASTDARKRLLHEAEITSALDHPGIISVYEAGRAGLVFYIASEYCPGPDLGQWLADRESPLSVEDAVELVRQLCSALQYAHEQGVVHRDLKPSNILLMPKGSPQENESPSALEFFPRLTDFGLAQLADCDWSGTRSSLLVGTPLYMAPEQLKLSPDQTGPATDIYALGTLLFELLTRRTPFAAENYVEMIDRLRNENPPSLQKLRADVPRDLETICAKCLEKDPADRYASVAQLAADLEQIQKHQPIATRRPTPIARLRKWSARHPAQVRSLALALLGTLVLLGVSQFYIGQAKRDRQAALSREEVSVDQARHAQQRSDDLSFAADVRQAGEALESNNAVQARELLARHLPNAGDTDRRGFVWHYLWGRLHQEEMTLEGHGPAFDVEYSPDGKLLACSYDSGEVVLYRADSGEKLQSLYEGVLQAVRKLDFPADGSLLAGARDDGQVIVWRTSDGAKVFSCQPHGEGIGDVAFHPQGKFLATCGDSSVKIFRLPDNSKEQPADQTFEPLVTLPDLPGTVYAVDISADGRLLAFAGEYDDASSSLDGYVTIWDWEKRSLVDTFYLSSKVYAIVFSNSSQWLAAGTQQGEVLLWDVEKQKAIVSWIKHASSVYDLSFSSDDRLLASAGKDSMVRLWNLEKRTLLRTLQGHSRRVYGTAISSTSGQIATASGDGFVKIWRPEDRSFSLRQLTWNGRNSRFSPDGQSVVVTGHGGIAIWHDLLSSAKRILPSIQKNYAEIGWQQSGERCVLAGKTDHWASTHTTIEEPATMINVDCDGDGDEDRITAFGSINRIVWQENRSGGRFQVPRILEPLGIEKRNSVSTDFEGNGTPDVLLISKNSGLLYFNRHKSHERSFDPVIFSNLATPVDLAAADLDADGDQDLLLATYGDNSILWLEQEGKSPAGTSRLLRRRKLTEQLQGAAAVVAADFTRDGLPDVVAAGIDDERILFFENLGEGSFSDGQRLEGSVLGPKALQVADVNEDGLPDVIAATNQQLVWFANQGSGHFHSARPITTLTAAKWLQPLPQNLVVYNTKEHLVEHRLPAYANFSNKAALSPDGTQLVAVDSRNIIRFWELPSERLLNTVAPSQDRIWDLAYSPDGRFLLLAVGDDLHVRDASDYRLLFVRGQHDNSINRIAVAHDSKHLATLSDDLTVRVWSLPDGQPQHILVGHESEPVSAAFSPDSRRLATGDRAGIVRVWDVTTGQQLIQFDLSKEGENLAANRIGDLVFSDERTLTATVHHAYKDQSAAILLAKWSTE